MHHLYHKEIEDVEVTSGMPRMIDVDNDKTNHPSNETPGMSASAPGVSRRSTSLRGLKDPVVVLTAAGPTARGPAILTGGLIGFGSNLVCDSTLCSSYVTSLTLNKGVLCRGEVRTLAAVLTAGVTAGVRSHAPPPVRPPCELCELWWVCAMLCAPCGFMVDGT